MTASPTRPDLALRTAIATWMTKACRRDQDRACNRADLGPMADRKDRECNRVIDLKAAPKDQDRECKAAIADLDPTTPSKAPADLMAIAIPKPDNPLRERSAKIVATVDLLATVRLEWCLPEPRECLEWCLPEPRECLEWCLPAECSAVRWAPVAAIPRCSSCKRKT
jgi:hypothetical protein